MQKSFLKFSNDYKQATIHYGDEKVTDFLESKEIAFKTITDLANKKKISIEDFGTMRDQILQNKKFPWTTGRNKRSEEEFLTSIKALAVIAILVGIDMDEEDETTSPATRGRARMETCICGTHYCKLITDKGVSPMLESKDEAMAWLEAENTNGLDPRDYDRLKKSIEKSQIPKNRQK